MCWVYDLDDDSLSKLDFSGSMLRCVLNGEKRLRERKNLENKKTQEKDREKDRETQDRERNFKTKSEGKVPGTKVELEPDHNCNIFKRQMELCMRWERSDVLKHVIEHSKLPNVGKEFKDALNQMVSPIPAQSPSAWTPCG